MMTRRGEGFMGLLRHETMEVHLLPFLIAIIPFQKRKSTDLVDFFVKYQIEVAITIRIFRGFNDEKVVMRTRPAGAMRMLDTSKQLA